MKRQLHRRVVAQVRVLLWEVAGMVGARRHVVIRGSSAGMVVLLRAVVVTTGTTVVVAVERTGTTAVARFASLSVVLVADTLV